MEGNGYKLVVGVDDGTTFTGIAYVLIRAGDQMGSENISSINKWPSSIGEQPSAPSLISYRQDGGPHLWGFEVNPEMRSYAWKKLLLDRNPQRDEFGDDLLERVTGSEIMKLPDQKEAGEAVADYLFSGLRLHPAPYPRKARWSGNTQFLMRQAIQRAGFGTSFLHRVWTITEPEAAALAVFSDGKFNLKQHDGVLICDCGGGTVDIATYYVTDVDPATSLEQITTVMGAKCGGTAINSGFYQLLFHRLGGDFDRLMSQIRPRSLVMSRFETIKTGFTGEGGNGWHFHFNLSAPGADPTFSNHRRGRVVLQPEDVRALYEPVLSKIFGLILSQISAANGKCGRDVINKVVLVGGFSASPYLQERLRHALNHIGNISVLVPRSPGEAIARGAALQGIRGHSIETYKCWRHYGLASVQPFDLSHGSESQGLGIGSNALPVNLLPHLLHKDQRYPKDFQTCQKIQLLHWEHDLQTKPVEIYESNLQVASQRLENSGKSSAFASTVSRNSPQVIGIAEKNTFI
ncbi:hypothetical protein PENFLA_c061G08046 [Penicillium flavigenum]|uniref:Uncharacterized protein n=1 Tax=Penicillium flavigenum TaxID=254877 RepID=A0A1V6SGX1_9EURO|nr:hypothetical protein PENFLA_c061G08046 [Penicillium flavigenum]